jgi:predicted TIM-barrel fold metal-dependent hydrolase
MINIHTHIFNIKCAPNNFYGIPVVRLLALAPSVSRSIIRALNSINPFSTRDKYSRLAALVEVGIERNQKEIFRNLLHLYREFENPRIVALTMDMDHMGAGKAIDDFITQVRTVAEVKAQYPQNLLPFFGVDPRRPNILELLKRYVDDFGFTGIKLYPSLGFYPFDKRLVKIYEFAISHQLPIMTHCDIGGIFYRGNYKSEHLLPESMNPQAPKRDFTAFRELKKGKFKDFFTQPLNFVDVLEMPDFRELKVCFAHFGGSEMITGRTDLSPTRSNWYEQIRQLLANYPNTYTDVSYTLHNSDEKIVKQVLTDMRDPVIGKKILFGTDYYMTVKVKDELALIRDFLKNYGISQEEFNALCMTNNSRFLQTGFFTP